MASPKIQSFKGLNNVSDPLRVPLGWLTRADNVNISATGRLTRRDGFTKVLSGAFTGAYSTQDYSRFFVVVAGVLQQIHADLSTSVLLTGLTAAPMHWSEVNREIFFSNGIDKGVIGTDNVVRPWAWVKPATPSVIAGFGALPAGLYQVACTFVLADGRETGGSDVVQILLADQSALIITNIPQVAGYVTQVYIAPADSAQFQLAAVVGAGSLTWDDGPDSLGENLTTLLLDPPPAEAIHSAVFGGRMYLMQYLPASDTTVVWFSEPLGFHLFDLNENFFMVRGQGVMLAAADTGLVIGTTTQIHGFDGEKLTLLADYGAVPGWSHATDENDPAKPLLFWTQRGVCSAFPFANLTSSRVSVPPGVRAGAAVINVQGARRYVVALQQGDTAFNPRSYP